MPTSITIRDIPDQVYQKIKVQAQRNHRSINGELVYQLTQLAQAATPNADELIGRAKALKAQANGNMKMTDIQNAIDAKRL